MCAWPSTPSYPALAAVERYELGEMVNSRERAVESTANEACCCGHVVVGGKAKHDHCDSAEGI